ncbi:MFS transporter [Kurthia huakuii]|uniref:MFS transporter n=1 Tax=Kurthia huakuii TaxID=1421019 RepID=UPI002E166CB9|nr:MFS family permease [Kurthia huakuii]
MMENDNQIFTKRFISLFFTNLSIFLVFYSLITTLPLYASGILDRTDDEAGLLVTAFLVSAILMRPFSGKLLDLYGKKRLLLISLLIYLACTILYVVFKEFTVLLGLRFFQGIWFSIATTAAGALAADIIPNKRKGTGLGYFTMSTNLAIVIGPFIGLLVIQYASFDALFLVLAVVVAIGSVLALTLNTRDLVQPKQQQKFRLTFNDLFEKKALPLAIVASVIAFAYSSILSFLSLYAEQQDLLGAASYFYAVLAVAMIGVRPFTGRIYDTYGAKYVIIPSFMLFAIGLVLLGNADNPALLLTSAIFLGMGYGTLTTSFQSLCVQATAPERTSYATATYFTLFDLGIAVGSYVLGIVAVSIGYSAIYMVSAALMLGMLLIYSLIFARSAKN